MKVAFVDRDGTLIFEPEDGLVRPEDYRILPGVIDGLKKLQDEGFVLAMVTNQNFLLGKYHEECFEKTQEMLIADLAEEGIEFDHIFLCPHAAEENCGCRKPKTGMVEQSLMFGDRETDREFAENIGVEFAKLFT